MSGTEFLVQVVLGLSVVGAVLRAVRRAWTQ